MAAEITSEEVMQVGGIVPTDKASLAIQDAFRRVAEQARAEELEACLGDVSALLTDAESESTKADDPDAGIACEAYRTVIKYVLLQGNARAALSAHPKEVAQEPVVEEITLPAEVLDRPADEIMHNPPRFPDLSPPPGPRFTVTPETVLDNRTGVMWQRAVSPEVYTWAEAKAYAANLTLAGHADWRLPTIEELQSIVDRNRDAPTIELRLAVFPDTPPVFFWSSSPFADSTSYAWGVYFYSGITLDNITTYTTRVRCARLEKASEQSPSPLRHTPGPWTVEVHEHETSVEAKHQTVTSDVSNSDAALIAAAPDLYAVARDAFALLDRYLRGGGGNPIPVLTALRIALHKAEGAGDAKKGK